MSIAAMKQIEELLAQYWDCAFEEGKTGISQGDKANLILHGIRVAISEQESEMNWEVRHGERRKPYKENPMSDLNKSPQELQTEIEALRSQVAALTDEQLRQAKVEVLREAADRLCGVHRDEIRSMADEIERSKT